MYLTNIRHESEVRGSLPLKTSSLKGEGFIGGKLLMKRTRRVYLLNTS